MRKQSHAETLIDVAYHAMEGVEDLMRYHERHGTPSLLILTQHCPEIAVEAVRLLAPDIAGKVVIEIGAGVGFLSIEMAKLAKQVIAIEVDPAWSWVFTQSLYVHKPKNLTWIFGTAESVADWIKGDVAIVFTKSGIKQMRKVAHKMAPKVIMPLSQGPLEAISKRLPNKPMLSGQIMDLIEEAMDNGGCK